MNEQSLSLATIYKGWDNYQSLLTRAIAPLSQEQLALRTAPHLRSVGMIATHIIAARFRWFHFVLGEGHQDLIYLAEWDKDTAQPRSAAELVSGLEATWQVIQQALEHWTSADLEQILQGTYRDEEYSFSRQWVIWHVIEHDLHHGGEISFVLGAHNLPAISA